MEVVVPDAGRAILHVDVDCFYAQVEEVRNPALRGMPLGVTQKYLIVTCNYPARGHGVTKLMNVAEARRRCPNIVLVSGEDLTPYRAASKQILAVLQRYGPAEKLGLDEVFVDVTAEAQRRLTALTHSGADVPAWQGHVHVSGTELVQDSRHRPMDLRVSADQQQAMGTAASTATAAAEVVGSPGEGSGVGGSGGNGWEALLRIGSVIASEARAAVLRETGCRTSAGVACNKMLAKLCSGLHKPDDQTVLPPPEGAAFVAPLPLRALPGVGHKMEQELTAAGFTSAADLRPLTRHQLVQRFGERTGAFLHAACRGKDPTLVQERGPPKSVTVEDSFKTCRGLAAAQKVVDVLAPDLLARLQEELQDGGRRPATLTVKWRHAGKEWERSSARCPMPSQVLSGRAGQEQQVAAIAAAALSVLRRSLPEPFDLSLINLGATAFTEGPAGAGTAAGTRSIADMFAAHQTAAEGTAGPDAGAPGLPGSTCQHPAAAQAAFSPQNRHKAALASTRAAAKASAQQRRSYSAAPAQAPLLSKRFERQLREQGVQQQEQQQEQQAGGLPPASLESWQQQQQQQQRHLGSGSAWYDEEEEEEGNDASMWDGLGGAASLRIPQLATAGVHKKSRGGGGGSIGGCLEQPQRASPAPALRTGAVSNGKQARPPPAGNPTYRNAEALRLQTLFGAAGSSGGFGGVATLAGCRSTLPSGPAAAGVSPEEQASLELAMRLQQQEVEAATAARKRGMPAATGGRQAKQQRDGRGPLDAFFSRK